MTPWGSDHFPVFLEYKSRASLGVRPQRWNMRRADWDKFQADLHQVFSTEVDGYDTAEDFTNKVLEVARESIPKNFGNPSRTPVPWLTKDCRDAIRVRHRAYRAFDRHTTTENLIAFRQARAAAR